MAGEMLREKTTKRAPSRVDGEKVSWMRRTEEGAREEQRVPYFERAVPSTCVSSLSAVRDKWGLSRHCDDGPFECEWRDKRESDGPLSLSHFSVSPRLFVRRDSLAFRKRK